MTANTPATITVEHLLQFRDGSPRENYVEAAPPWSAGLLTSEYSPFRAFLDGTQPGQRLRLRVTLEVGEL